jgi:hypothetical protein
MKRDSPHPPERLESILPANDTLGYEDGGVLEEVSHDAMGDVWDSCKLAVKKASDHEPVSRVAS